MKPFKPPSRIGDPPASSKSNDKKPTPAASSTPKPSTPVSKPAASSTPTTPAGDKQEASSATKKFKPPSAVKGFTPPASTKSSPVAVSKDASPAPLAKEEDDAAQWQYWNVMHTKRSNKKHKVYEDGIMIVKRNKYILLDNAGKKVTERTESKTIQDWKPGQTLSIGTKEIEFQHPIKAEDFISGAIFMNFAKSEDIKPKQLQISKAAKQKFKQHAQSNVPAGFSEQALAKARAPEGTILLNKGHPQTDAKDKLIYDVYIDYYLTKLLRPHQVEGVQFMYDCVMGNKMEKGNGCLLADEMGLGKTLQSIALMTVLANGGPTGKPEMKKGIVITNSSLVKNWEKEFNKWVGSRNMHVMTCTSKEYKSNPTEIMNTFKHSHHQVLIMSYGLALTHAKTFLTVPCDLLICDEGHKLKNNNIKIFKVLNALKTKRKIVLSGTPLQNDLNEFYCIVDFLNPGLLGTEKSFKHVFADPINKSREPSAKPAEKSVGLARSQLLNQQIGQFVLRRTNKLLLEHLPPKAEISLFVKLQPLQSQLYRTFVKSKYVFNLLSENLNNNNALSCMQHLRMLLTHPDKIYEKITSSGSDKDDKDDSAQGWAGALGLFGKNYENELKTELSGKLQLLDNLLEGIWSQGDKVVIVSNYTSVLDVLELYLKSKGYKYGRLDGSIASAEKRMNLVDHFNSCVKEEEFIFLLSSKAGGCGLNIIGANRLIMFDPDWNPSTDEQAMARVWRDGQKKNVFIYRFISTGTIEEKMLQRQIVKKGLSKTVVDETNLKAAFSKNDLRQVFVYNDETICETYKDEAKKGNNIDESLKKFDPVLFNAIEGKDLITFVKISKEVDEEAYKMTLDDDNIKEEENDNESVMAPSDEGEAEFNFDDIDNKLKDEEDKCDEKAKSDDEEKMNDEDESNNNNGDEKKDDSAIGEEGNDKAKSSEDEKAKSSEDEESPKRKRKKTSKDEEEITKTAPNRKRKKKIVDSDDDDDYSE